MAQFHLTSIAAFDAPLLYHTGAQQFLAFHGPEINRRATAFLAELERTAPDKVGAIQNAITTLAQRFADEEKVHAEAVDYLFTHRQFHANAEAALAGLPPPTFAALGALGAENWAVFVNTAVHGCFAEFQHLMNGAEHDLFSLDDKLKRLEYIVETALRNDTNNLKSLVPIHSIGDALTDIKNALDDTVIQQVIDFVRDHANQIYWMMDKLREGLEWLFLPLVDGQTMQTFQDYLAGVLEAYTTRIHQPCPPTIQAFMADYQPPLELASYHQVMPQVPGQQKLTITAMTGTVSNLQQSQLVNEALVLIKIVLIGILLDSVVNVVASFAVVTLPVTGISLIDNALSLAQQGAAWVTERMTMEALLAALGSIMDGVPFWLLAVAGLEFTIKAIQVAPAIEQALVTKTAIAIESLLQLSRAERKQVETLMEELDKRNTPLPQWLVEVLVLAGWSDADIYAFAELSSFVRDFITKYPTPEAVAAFLTVVAKYKLEYPDVPWKDIAYMVLQGYDDADMARVLPYYDALRNQGLQHLFDNGLTGDASAQDGAARTMAVLVAIGGNNVYAIDKGIEVATGPHPGDTDVDILTKNGDVIQIGGAARKANNSTDFEAQLQKSFEYAGEKGGHVIVYLETNANGKNQNAFKTCVALYTQVAEAKYEQDYLKKGMDPVDAAILAEHRAKQDAQYYVRPIGYPIQSQWGTPDYHNQPYPPGSASSP